MARIIDKKIWPDKFEEDQSYSLDFRLADFDLEPGDQIRFMEWDPKTETFTGRKYIRTVLQAIRSESPTRYWTVEQLEKNGMYLIEWAK
jgi:hypothetical protein